MSQQQKSSPAYVSHFKLNQKTQSKNWRIPLGAPKGLLFAVVFRPKNALKTNEIEPQPSFGERWISFAKDDTPQYSTEQVFVSAVSPTKGLDSWRGLHFWGIRSIEIECIDPGHLEQSQKVDLTLSR